MNVPNLPLMALLISLIMGYVLAFNREAYRNVNTSSCSSVVSYNPSQQESSLIYKLPRNNTAYNRPADLIDISGLMAYEKGYSSSPDLSYLNWYHMRYFADNNVAVTVPAKSMFSNIMDHARRRVDTGCFNKCDKLPPKNPKVEKVDNTKLGLTQGDLIDTIVNAKRVLVMRDPFDRLLSAYYNSFEHPGIYVGNCCQVKDGACADNKDGRKNYKSCSLKEFVLQIGRDTSNDHVQPQIDSSHYGMIYYHYIIRVSSLADVECLFALIGEQYEGGHNESPNTSIDVKEKAAYFDQEMAQVIRRVYSHDILLWKVIQSLPGATPSVMNYIAY